MGIPKLLSFLQPYGIKDTLKPGSGVVIDGPGFAYHIHSLCANHADNQYQQISYNAIMGTAVSWLNGLVNCGLQIHAIYFDGFLPVSKRPTRLRRLQAATHDAAEFYAWVSRQAKSTRKQSKKPTTSGRKMAVMPSPFLVPAVIEALRRSPQYGAITHIVPMEAETACAIRVRSLSSGGFILTGDSDALLYDIGACGGVVFFRTVYQPLGDHAHLPNQLDCVKFYPQDITTHLGVPLSRLAYELSHKKYNRLGEAVRACSGPTLDPDLYSRFLDEHLGMNLPSHAAEYAAYVASQLQFMDPRLAEIYLQFLEAQPTKPHEATQSTLAGPLVFLPPLIDCPTWRSLWSMSISIRQLAYTLISQTVASDVAVVWEHVRVQSLEARGKPINILAADAAEAMVHRLLSDFKGISTALGVDSDELWFIIALYSELYECRPSSILNLGLGRLNGLNLLELDNPYSTYVRYMNTLTHSVLYSLRFLAQALKIQPRHTTKEHSPSYYALQRFLNRLPLLDQYPTMEQTAKVLRGISLSRICSISELSSHMDLDFMAASPQSRVEPLPRHNVGQDALPRVTYVNPFDILRLES